VARVGNEQDQPIRTKIAALRGNSALDQLNVVNAGLGFDEAGSERACDNGIATPWIARDRDRYFNSPSNGRAQAPPKPGEQRQVTSITYGITARMQRRRELQPDSRGKPRNEVDRQDGCLASLDFRDQ
jgi:hypothetical protein